ncbi:Ldh family oxidoreductase [Arenibaculum pallidiluteum]|uniref:Ldh family oxidoreductase n=1 Tax=Arenibaculum pallidiluteum TaxID=2812559 RepID=UPI001A96CCE5|nr:Ldh family oxidoreductase [Arenibaculum pallidiluteum]
MDETRYHVDSLAAFTGELLAAAGMAPAKAEAVARLLVQTDMLGRHTHGVALAPLYVEQLEKGLMTPDGEPDCLRDTGSTIVWDGNYLPGLWLVERALQLGLQRIATHGVVTFAIRRSHHIACLATLVKQATDRGCVAILMTSDPAFGFVAPYGGREPLLTPNPFAIGYPGTRTPVLVDICASITTVSMTRQKAATGEHFEHEWLLDGQGRPTRDPRVLEQTDPRGSIMLLGGLEYGHKGFGLALMVEALTQGLAGFGRRDSEKRWGGNVFLQLLDPEAFAGREVFLAQMDHLTERCHENAPLQDGVPVRMPGEQAERNMAAARQAGVRLAPLTVQRLSDAAGRYGIALPGTT